VVLEDPLLMIANYTSGTAKRRLATYAHKESFDPAFHRRRLAILGIPVGTHIALVPADTAVGDILIAIAPKVLPLVLSPTEQNRLNVAQLYKSEYSWSSVDALVTSLSETFSTPASTKKAHYKQRARLENVVGVFGPKYKIQGPAFSIQGYDFRPDGSHRQRERDCDFDFGGFHAEMNWSLAMQEFIIV
jgi:hypothetical protein